MKIFIKFLFFVAINGLLCNSLIGFAESKDLKNNRLQLKNLPLPLIEVASKSVNSERNPFLGLNKRTEQMGINPKTFFTLMGIIQTGDKLSVMLKSPDGFNLFKEGEYINKIFKIKKISLDNETVVFTNGENEFKLEFPGK